jgi:hypothetical protein
MSSERPPPTPSAQPLLDEHDRDWDASDADMMSPTDSVDARDRQRVAQKYALGSTSVWARLRRRAILMLARPCGYRMSGAILVRLAAALLVLGFVVLMSVLVATRARAPPVYVSAGGERERG